jgi:hypothetical protein
LNGEQVAGLALLTRARSECFQGLAIAIDAG